MLSRARDGTPARSDNIRGDDTLLLDIGIQTSWQLMDITGTRLWRIVSYYVDQAIARFDLSAVCAFGLDETAYKRVHHYVTVFIDMARCKEPVQFDTLGRGKDTLPQHDGEPGQILEVICDMSPVFLRGVEQHLRGASIPVDWFHIVQLFTRSVDEVRKLEGKEKPLLNLLRWAVLKRGHVDRLTTNQLVAVGEMTEQGLETMTVWKLKEKPPWIRKARTPRTAPWWITYFLNYARALVGDTPRLEPGAHSAGEDPCATRGATLDLGATPMPAWRASTGHSRPHGREPADTATPTPSSP